MRRLGLQVVALMLSDVVGEGVDFIASGPTSPLEVSPSYCLQILHQLNVIKQVPQSVREVLTQRCEFSYVHLFHADSVF